MGYVFFTEETVLPYNSQKSTTNKGMESSCVKRAQLNVNTLEIRFSDAVFQWAQPPCSPTANTKTSSPDVLTADSCTL
jgi:hypothetical protein